MHNAPYHASSVLPSLTRFLCHKAALASGWASASRGWARAHPGPPVATPLVMYHSGKRNELGIVYGNGLLFLFFRIVCFVHCAFTEVALYKYLRNIFLVFSN